MSISIEVRTTLHDESSIHVKKAIANMASLCGYPSGYDIGNPTTKFGWTFYTIHLNNDLVAGIESKFEDMIGKSRSMNDKFISFMEKYFEARGARVNLKLLPD